MRKTESQKIALCGVLGALSVVLLMLGNILQVGTYAAPMLACFLLIPVLEEYGSRYALMLYAVVSVLGVMLVPDKELALFYALVLGYYPVLRVALNKIRSAVLRWMAKFACFNAATVAMYLFLIVVLAPPELVAEFAQEGTAMLVLLLAMGNLCFWLCDRALYSMTILYRLKIHPKLKKMF
ncbi:MAG: hypothetical protein ACI4KN_08825 [Gemmiger sp.]